nr:CsgG/HfaB family protein [uncultured Dethiosulfovibrio sp.]
MIRRTAAAIFMIAAFCPSAWGFALAVADFKPNGVPFHLGSAVSEVIRIEMASIPGVDLTVVDVNHVKKAASEQRIGMSGLVDPASAAKVGKVVGARYVLVGSVNSLGGEVSLESRLIDVETGTILDSLSVVSYDGQEGLIEAARFLAGDLKMLLVSSDG